jgi:hypothetical protein
MTIGSKLILEPDMIKKTAAPKRAVAKLASSPAPTDLPPGASAIVGKDGKTAITMTESSDNHFMKAGGSKVPSFNSVLLRQVLDTLWCTDSSAENQSRVVSAAYAALAAFKPTDEIEGMLAAQAVAMHHGAMECFRRSMIADQPGDVAAKLRRDGVNLARGMMDMIAALDRKRGKGQQVVRVERVVVHEGGQAIVGSVQSQTPRHAGEG